MSLKLDRSPVQKLYAPPPAPGFQRMEELCSGSDATPTASPPTASPAAAASPAKTDAARGAGRQYQTVGDYFVSRVEDGVRSAGRVAEGVAELAPPILLTQIAAIHVSHDVQAGEQILNLPWDPKGKWRGKADQIIDTEHRAARREVGNLPVVVGARDAYQFVAESGSYLVKAADAVASAVVHLGKDAAYTALGAVAYAGTNMVDIARHGQQALQ